MRMRRLVGAIGNLEKPERQLLCAKRNANYERGLHMKFSKGIETYGAMSRAREAANVVSAWLTRFGARAHARILATSRDVRGQGTTEYAILVGVLVVIAILAITLFRPKLQELWTAIADGINSL